MLFKTEQYTAAETETQCDLFLLFLYKVFFCNPVKWDRHRGALGITCSDPSVYTHAQLFPSHISMMGITIFFSQIAGLVQWRCIKTGAARGWGWAWAGGTATRVNIGG